MLIEAITRINGFADVDDPVFENDLVDSLLDSMLLLEICQLFQCVCVEDATRHFRQCFLQLFSDRPWQIEVGEIEHAWR